MIDSYIYILIYVIEFLTALYYFSNIYHSKKSLLHTVLTGFVCYSAACIVFLFAVGNTYINTPVFIVLNIVWVLTAFKSNIKNAVLLSFVLTATMTITEFLAMETASLVLDCDISNITFNKTFVILSAAFSKALYFLSSSVISRIARKFVSKDSQKNVTPGYLFVYPASSLFVIIVYWFLTVENTLSSRGIIFMMISIGMLLLSIIITYFFYFYTVKKENEVLALQTELDRIEVDETYYKLLDYQSENIKRIAHDEKNHLLAIKNMKTTDEIGEYIDEIYSDLQEYSEHGMTFNKQLDYIINRYKIQCEVENIHFITSIMTSNLSFMDKTDLTALISNLMDNAVEAARQSEAKTVELSINKTFGVNAITCVNSCDNKPKIYKTDLKTTKSSSGIHGYGLKSIKRVVKKYNGEYSWKYDEEKKEFITVISLME